MSDHYETLGLRPTASKSDIKNAYFRLAHRYHPDHHAHADAAARDAAASSFRRAKDAYEVLSDDTRRAEFDRIARPFSSSSASRGFQPSSDPNSDWLWEHAKARGFHGGASSNRHGQYGAASFSWERAFGETDPAYEEELFLKFMRARRESDAYGPRYYGGSSSSAGCGYDGASTASGNRRWGGGVFQRRPMGGGNAGANLALCCAAVLLCWGMDKYKHYDMMYSKGVS